MNLGVFDSVKKLQGRRSRVREGEIKRTGRRKRLPENMEGNSDPLTLFSCLCCNCLASERKGRGILTALNIIKSLMQVPKEHLEKSGEYKTEE